LFTKKFEDIDIKLNQENFDYLIQTIRNNDYLMVKRLLNEDPNLVHFYDKLNQYPIHWAAKRKSYKIASLIISKNSPIDCQDLAGRTPLHLSVENSCLDLIKVKTPKLFIFIY